MRRESRGMDGRSSVAWWEGEGGGIKLGRELEALWVDVRTYTLLAPPIVVLQHGGPQGAAIRESANSQPHVTVGSLHDLAPCKQPCWGTKMGVT